MLTTKELNKLDIIKLLEEAHKAKKELFEIQFKVRTGQSKENHKINDLKRYIARVKTIQHSKKGVETVEAK